MEAVIQPMELGDIFDRTFRLAGRLFKQNIIVVLTFLAVPGLVLAWGLHYFYSGIGSVNGAAGSSDGFISVMTGLLVLMITGGVAAVGYLGAQIGVSRLACAAIKGETMTWQDAVDEAFSARLVKTIGLMLLLYLTLVALICGAAIIIGILSAISRILGLIGILLLFGAVAVGLFLWIRWSVAATTIAWENRGVIESLDRSKHLIAGSWWRIFGILILLGLVIQFAATLVATPVMFIFILGSLRDIFSLRAGAPPPPGLMESLGTAVGVSVALTMILESLVKPIYLSLIYFDLRARKGEFPFVPPPPAPSGPSDHSRFIPGSSSEQFPENPATDPASPIV